MNRPIPTLSENDLTRFWSKVDKKRGCWLWIDELDKNGYGRFSVCNYPYFAHRISFTIEKSCPGDLNVNHTCDNPRCVNPEHLWLGTQKDGMNDKIAKNRQSKGESHGNHILTEKQVGEILESDIKRTLLAKKYGVHASTITEIKRDQGWKHIEGKRYTGPLRSDNKTGVKGVSRFRDRYQAGFVLKGKAIHVGHFDTIEKAAQAITKKRLELSCETD